MLVAHIGNFVQLELVSAFSRVAQATNEVPLNHLVVLVRHLMDFILIDNGGSLA